MRAVMDPRRFQRFDIILVCGLSGASKSHFARDQLMQSGRKRVNRKEIRRLHFETTSFGQKWAENELAM